MKTLKFTLITFLMSIILISCVDGNSPVGVLNPEKFTTIITGGVNTEITFDEDKFRDFSSGDVNFEETASTYLAITATNSSATMDINLYPPENHPRKNDIITISIKTKSSKPWTKNQEYTTPYIDKLQDFEEYAIVSYWSDEDRRDYVSFYTREAGVKKVKLWRDGKLLKGSLGTLKLSTFNGSRNVTIESLVFELRPEDDDLVD